MSFRHGPSSRSVGTGLRALTGREPLVDVPVEGTTGEFLDRVEALGRATVDRRVRVAVDRGPAEPVVRIGYGPLVVFEGVARPHHVVGRHRVRPWASVVYWVLALGSLVFTVNEVVLAHWGSAAGRGSGVLLAIMWTVNIGSLCDTTGGLLTAVAAGRTGPLAGRA